MTIISVLFLLVTLEGYIIFYSEKLTMRKSLLWKLLSIVVFVLSSCIDDNPKAPNGLTIELLRAPSQAVITDPKPEFAWIVNDPRRGATQSARQIIVASSQENIDYNQGDMWDSGKILSKQCVNVEYQGKPLWENSVYWWKVRIWDQNGIATPYSAAQRFRTGRLILLPNESKWIKTDTGQYLLENRQRADYRQISPMKFIQLGPGHYFADFGRAAFATLKIHIKDSGEKDSLILFLGERKTANNRVHKNPGKSNIGYKKIVLTLKKDIHEYTINLPRHISHAPNGQQLAEHMPEVLPFRYVEILNAPPTLKSGNISQLALYYYFDDSSSSFNASNDTLNKVWGLCKYTLKATPFLGLYADGNRERMPYEADAYIQQLGHYCVDREYAIARYTLQFLLDNPSWPTEWHMHTVFMAYADYMYTGSTELIEKYYDRLKAKTLTALEREDGLISTRTGLLNEDVLRSLHFSGKKMHDIVDWPAGTPKGKKQASNQGPTPEGERDGYVFSDYNTVVNAFHYRALVLMSRMAKAVGETSDAVILARKAERVKASINRLMFDEIRGVYKDGATVRHASLHANMFPLAFDIIQPQNMNSVVSFIKSRGMACSVYGAQYLLDGLYKAGESAYALQLMISESKRSWMNMIKVGSTMTTEAWDEYYKPNLTWNHAWGTAPANIIARKLMGIEPLLPAFRKIRIKPQPSVLKNINIKIPTIRGAVTMHWQARGEQFALSVKIPANSSAQIWLPAESRKDLRERGLRISEITDIRFLGRKDGFFIYEVPAGSFLFSGLLRRNFKE